VPKEPVPAPQRLARVDLQRLLDALRALGYRVVGPVPRDGAIVFDEVRRVDDLPVGLRETQAPGRYGLTSSGRNTVFDVVNGPGSLKPLVFAPREPLLQIERNGRSFCAAQTVPDAPKVAVLGVRACDLAALRVQDRVFLQDRYPDAHYAARRANLFLVAVNCTRSAETCFCVSMGTGPEAAEGYDLVLTEQDDSFLARAGSPGGEEVLATLPVTLAPADAVARERVALSVCAASMKRSLDTSDLPEMLYRNLDSPHWKEVGERCLSCGNCTMVCPTCFCHDERDDPLLGEAGDDGMRSVRVREWDSCFNREHAQVHGMNFRPKTEDRYRQWLVHKLASWIDQFGTSGCVGCGRCITWCPVGIDLTEEVVALREPRV
jgi:ferredoxin